MADIANHAPSSAAPALSGLAARVEELRSRFAKWRLYRRTFNELNALSDRELADLGLHRATLQSVAWHAVHDR